MELGSRILYCDADCLAVNKLAGEAVEGAAPGMGDLPAMLVQYFAASENNSQKESPDSSEMLSVPVAVHRLDVPVTGCALFARTSNALVFLNNAFSGKNCRPADIEETPNAGIIPLKKYYWAIVEMPGREIKPAGNLAHWIQFDSGRNKTLAFDEPGPGRKKAELAYRITGAGRNYLFIEIQLFSGRHHQIRCQLARMGLHIKGDLKYGARRSEPNGGIRLHARSLAFPLPPDSKRITVQADPPVMDNLWQAFTENL